MIHKLLSVDIDQAHDGCNRGNDCGYLPCRSGAKAGRYSRAQSRGSQIRVDRECRRIFAHLLANCGSLRRGQSEPQVVLQTAEQIHRRPIRGSAHRLEKDATHLSDRRANASDHHRSNIRLCIAGRTAHPSKCEWRSPVWLRLDRLSPIADAHHRLRL